MTNEVIIKLPKPFDLQRSFMNDESRFKVLCAGRRWGKTELLTIIIGMATAKGQNVAYCSMSYKQMTETFNKVLSRMKPMVSRQNLAQYSFNTVMDGKLTCWSGGASSTTRGAGYDLFIIDEASFIPNLWDKFTGDILPTLADKQGNAIICSTPNGFNDFYRIYQLGVDGEQGWRSYRYPTRTSPMVKAEELEALRAVMPELKFREEFEAEFVSSEGVVFRSINNVLYEPPAIYKPKRAVMGVDWGRMNDYTAISVWDVDTASELELVRFNKLDWAFQLERLKSIAEKWGVGLILAESNSIGQPQIEGLAKQGLPVKPFATTAQSKPAIIEALALAIEKGEIKLVNDEIGLQELSSYTATQSTNGTMRYGAPSGGHDDTVIARAIGYRACSQINSDGVRVFNNNPFTGR